VPRRPAAGGHHDPDLGIELMPVDIVVASDDCRFSQLEVKHGIMATGGATLRMTERAGLGNALLHLLTGDEFGAAEALRLKFVQKGCAAGSNWKKRSASPRPWPRKLRSPSSPPG
jgi:enoyl-CoA hydratase/carnithine racemase